MSKKITRSRVVQHLCVFKAEVQKKTTRIWSGLHKYVTQYILYEHKCKKRWRYIVDTLYKVEKTAAAQGFHVLRGVNLTTMGSVRVDLILVGRKGLYAVNFLRQEGVYLGEATSENLHVLIQKSRKMEPLNNPLRSAQEAAYKLKKEFSCIIEPVVVLPQHSVSELRGEKNFSFYNVETFESRLSNVGSNTYTTKEVKQLVRRLKSYATVEIEI